MAANATDVVTVAQLKDYDENRATGGGGSGYTYKNAILSASPSTFGDWVLQSVEADGYDSPIVALCYNDSELVIECVSTMYPNVKWQFSITNNAKNVHCLATGNSSQEEYPMYIGVPYVGYSVTDAVGVCAVLIDKTGDTLTVETHFTTSGVPPVMTPHLRFYATEE